MWASNLLSRHQGPTACPGLVDSHTFLGNYSVSAFYVSTVVPCPLLGKSLGEEGSMYA
jgi:hypothetical protein